MLQSAFRCIQGRDNESQVVVRHNSSDKVISLLTPAFCLVETFGQSSNSVRVDLSALPIWEQQVDWAADNANEFHSLSVGVLMRRLSRYDRGVQRHLLFLDDSIVLKLGDL